METDIVYVYLSFVWDYSIFMEIFVIFYWHQQSITILGNVDFRKGRKKCQRNCYKSRSSRSMALTCTELVVDSIADQHNLLGTVPFQKLGIGVLGKTLLLVENTYASLCGIIIIGWPSWLTAERLINSCATHHLPSYNAMWDEITHNICKVSWMFNGFL